LYGDAGPDLIRGGADDDRCLQGTDGHGWDTIRGNQGRDVFQADPGDRVSGAEVEAPADKFGFGPCYG
jgi:hypothetical protein